MLASKSGIQNRNIQFKDLGTHCDYRKTWQMQEDLLNNIVQIKIQRSKFERENPDVDLSVRNAFSTPNHLFFLEHPHVYTLGKSGDEQNMLANAQKLKEIEATYVKTNRGGDITYHGPGQLVGYPILDLDNFKTDLNWYMRSLEEVIIQTIANYGLKGERSPGETGVWLDVGKPFARKICAMGVRTSRWVTMHGFALNANTDLRYFEYIIPCGIKGKAVTSLQRELNMEIDMDELKALVKKNFEEIFLANFFG